MVIGNGLISSCFKKFINDDNYIIFASGVSNSNEDRDSEYDREFSLIKENLNTNSKFIYFSTTNNSNKKYFLHKRKMEEFIISNSKKYLIFRLPNVVGNGGNNTNIFNYFRSRIINNEIIKIKDVTRSLVDITDIKNICLKCLDIENKILNISYIEKIKVKEILYLMSSELNINPIVDYINSSDDENNITNNSIEIENAINELKISVKDYTKKLIKKYIKQ